MFCSYGYVYVGWWVMKKTKGLFKKLDFKVKMGLIFCLIPIIVWIIYGVVHYLCKCSLPRVLQLPLIFSLYPARFYELFIMRFFHCGKDSGSAFSCIVGPLLWLILYFLTWFLVGGLIGFIVQKVKKGND